MSEGEAVAALIEQVKLLNGWLGDVGETDMCEIVADGGITAGMVVGQEAREQQRRLRAALQRVFDARLSRSFREPTP